MEDWDEHTVLHAAILEENIHYVQQLLHQKVDIDYRYSKLGTPLHAATIKNNKDIVSLLLEKGAYVNSFDSNFETPLFIASKYGYYEIVKLLLEFNANTSFQNLNQQIPLHIASLNNHEKVIQLLLTYAANVNAKDINGKTPLYIAVENNCIDAVKSILELKTKTDVNCPNGKNMQTPLHAAVEKNCLDIIELLLKNGADPNRSDATGVKPIFMAAEGKADDVLQLLLNNGGDINIRNKVNETPLHVVIRHSNYCLGRILLDNYDPDVNAVDEKELAPLHYCYKKPELVKLLIENGAGTLPKSDMQKSCIAALDQKSKRIILCHQTKIKILENHFNKEIEKVETCSCGKTSCVPEFEAEIKEMKKIKLNGSITLFDVLFMEPNLLARYAKNKILKELYGNTIYHKRELVLDRPSGANNLCQFCEMLYRGLPDMNISIECNHNRDNDSNIVIILYSNFEEKFMHYGFLLNQRYRKGLKKRAFYDSAVNSLKHLTGFFQMPDECFEEIFVFLNNATLNTLVELENSRV